MSIVKVVVHKGASEGSWLQRMLARKPRMVVAVPDFSTLSRQGEDLTLHAPRKTTRSHPVNLVVDSIDLKIFGAGEWLGNPPILDRVQP